MLVYAVVCGNLCFDIPTGSTKVGIQINNTEQTFPIIDIQDGRKNNETKTQEENIHETPKMKDFVVPPHNLRWIAPRAPKYPNRTNNQKRNVAVYKKQPRNRGYNHTLKRKQW